MCPGGAGAVGSAKFFVGEVLLGQVAKSQEELYSGPAAFGQAPLEPVGLCHIGRQELNDFDVLALVDACLDKEKRARRKLSETPSLPAAFLFPGRRQDLRSAVCAYEAVHGTVMEAFVIGARRRTNRALRQKVQT